MSAPVLWIGLPLGVAAIFFFVRSPRTLAIQGGSAAAFLSIAALLIPIDTALVIGPISLKLGAATEILGRSFGFVQSDGALLAFIYGTAAVWFFGSLPAGAGRRFVPLGMAIIALLVASLAVEPFLFAAPLIEIAAMLAVPLIIGPGHTPGNGILRFITYQTLAVPFILLSGWMLAGVEASPSDIAMTTQAAVMLGLGFAFLLAIYPLYTWIPMLAEETGPYVLGFMLWTLHVFSLVFAMGFLDRYAWLRTSPQLSDGIALAAGVMIASAGWFAAFERHLGRIMALAAIAETGLVLLALSLGASGSLEISFMLLLPRGIELALWALALSILARNSQSLFLQDAEGLARNHPVAGAALILANLSMAGLPLLAGFPARLLLGNALNGQSNSLAPLLLVGLLGILVASFRSLAALFRPHSTDGWRLRETRLQVVMLGAGMGLLIALGLFPQLTQGFLSGLAGMFEHLAAEISML